MWLVAAVVALGATFGGIAAWSLETRKLYRRGAEEWPVGMDPLQRERWVLRRRRRWRLVKTALSALAGAAVAFVMVLALALRR